MTDDFNEYTDEIFVDFEGDKWWYINGIKYSFAEWLQLCSLSDEEKCELILYNK